MKGVALSIPIFIRSGGNISVIHLIRKMEPIRILHLCPFSFFEIICQKTFFFILLACSDSIIIEEVNTEVTISKLPVFGLKA